MGNRQNLSPARNQKTTELTNFSSFPDLNQKILQKKVCAALRHTAKVKDLVTRMMRQGALWQDCGDGWQALERGMSLKSLKLAATGWS